MEQFKGFLEGMIIHAKRTDRFQEMVRRTLPASFWFFVDCAIAASPTPRLTYVHHGKYHLPNQQEQRVAWEQFNARRMGNGFAPVLYNPSRDYVWEVEQM